MTTTNKKLTALRDEMIERFGVSRREAELVLTVGGLVAVKVAEAYGYELEHFNRDDLKDELHRIVNNQENKETR